MKKIVVKGDIKQCSLCKEWLALDKFYIRKNSPGTRDCYCRQCRSNFNKQNYDLEGSRRKHRYGITPSQYKKMYEFQNGRCAICEIEKSKLVVDHSHSTNKIRGLLCNGCNIILGSIHDDTGKLQNAINYLNKNNPGNTHYYNVLINEPEPKKIHSSKTKSGFVGISWRPEKNKWRAFRKGKHIGYFKTIEEAISAYNDYLNKIAA